MTTQLNSSFPLSLIEADAGFASLMTEKFQQRMARLERLGIRLFGVANCILNFGKLSGKAEHSEHSMYAVEASFCNSLEIPDDLLVVSDTKLDAQLMLHKQVTGAPYIRFYAVYPMRDTTGKIIGSIALIDYKPHHFDDESRQLFADLLVMAEREMLISAMQQSYAELQKVNRNLRRNNLIDPILGTWNKAAIVRSLSIEMERCVKSEKPLALMFASLDQMAQLQETYGISLGDRLLLKVVSRIRSCIRPFDALGRFGNEVFLVVLPGASQLVATAVAERIRLTIMAHPEVIEDEENSTVLTISAGVVATDVFPDADPEMLINIAEKALLSAKKAGINRVAKAIPAQPDKNS